MQTAFQSNAFQASGFQIVATQAQASGGYGFGAYDAEGRRRKRRQEEPEAAAIAAQIVRLERHIAREQRLPVRAVRLKAQVHKQWLPPDAIRAVQHAMSEQSARAFRSAEIAVRRAREQEEEDFAVLLLMAIH